MWGVRGKLIALFAALSLSALLANAWTGSNDRVPFERVMVKCGPPAEDLVNGTYVTVGQNGGRGLVAQVTEYRKGLRKNRFFNVQPAKCPCPKAYEGKKLRLQVSDLSMSWLTQGPKRSQYLATLEYKVKPAARRKTLGMSCNIL
jgi:hypothetical protein